MTESNNHDRSTIVSVLDEPNAKLKRRSYTREKKIEVLDWYFNDGRNKYQACKKFAINSKTLAEWLRDEAKIRASNRGTRKMGAGRKPFWPDMEVSCKVMDVHHRRSPLVQGGLEIPCKVIVEMEMTGKNYLAIDKYKQLVSDQYQEPVEGKFPDATQQILEAMKSPSDEEMDYGSDSSTSESEPE